MRFSLVSIISYAVAVGAIKEDYKIFESVPKAPSPWVIKDGGKVDLNQSFKLRIHLKNQNIAAFKQQVLDASTPDHPSYGQHKSRAEVNKILAPSTASYDLVQAWLELHQLTSKATVENDWIVIQGTIQDAGNLLNAQYQSFENTDTGKITARTLAYSLPTNLHNHIDIIAPTIKFPSMSAQRSTIVPDFESSSSKVAIASFTDQGTLDVAAACNSSITVDCLKSLYKIGDFKAAKNDGNNIALAGFLEEYAQHDDLAQFLATYVPQAVGADFSEILINGSVNLQDNTAGPQSIGEANLDIQYGLGLAYPINTTYISTAGRPPETTPNEVDNEPYLEFLTHLLAQESIPQVISISYGDSEWTVPTSYAHTICDLFAQVTARGVTILASSGDSGSGSNCRATDPTKLLYTPALPASCPWVTAVGGTRYIEPERAVSFSGGGFSNFFPRPEWQNSTIAKYLDEKADPAFKQYYNTSGRAYPDVSAQGVFFHTILTGSDQLISGTSASSPAFAAIVALLNSDRMANNLPVFGFLNPWLYSKGANAFTDIVVGKGAGCSQVANSGFPAVAGWDPVTGLGTPDFPKLRTASTGKPSYEDRS